MTSHAGRSGELQKSREWPTDTLPVGELIRHRAYGLWLMRDEPDKRVLASWP
jgi:hypothetical protein